MKILIIEDEPAIRETLQDILEFNGHTVRTATDGETGLAAAAERPDLILCDIGLPGMDGYDVISALRQQPHGSDVPFIFLTARADRADQRRGMALGADDYITKPFTERDLLDAIAVRVSRQRRLRERVEQLIEQHRREISADWSHELMTPLNGVLGGLELIEMEGEGISQAELKDLLGLIRTGAERQQRLSRKLVRYFELERLKDAPAGAQAYSCRADATLTDAARAAATAAQRPQDLRLECEPGEVPLHADYLADAVTELVGNAFRFSEPGQPVRVTGRRSAQRYRIEVRDEGPGMSAEQREHIGAFTQFDRNRREQQGLGLGLAIARAVAEIGGGSLTLDAGPDGRGLRVTLDLPGR